MWNLPPQMAPVGLFFLLYLKIQMFKWILIVALSLTLFKEKTETAFQEHNQSHKNKFHSNKLPSFLQFILFCADTISSESTPALPNPSQMDLYEQRASQTRRYPPSVSSSPQKDMQPKVRPHYPSFLLEVIKMITHIHKTICKVVWSD